MAIAKKSPTDMTVGERIVVARLMIAMSQAELARKLGVAQTQISRYENDRSAPRTTMLKSLADALEVSVRWLATGEGGINAHELKEPVPEGETEVSVELTDEHYAELRRLAAINKRTVAEELRVLLQTALQLQSEDGIARLAELVADKLKDRP